MRAASEGGRVNADKEFDKLFYDQNSPIRDDIKDLKQEAKDKLRECLIKEAVVTAVPDSVRKTEIIKSCFGPSATSTP